MIVTFCGHGKIVNKNDVQEWLYTTTENLILAYLNSSVAVTDYCYTLYPPIEAVPKRFAILKRNEWMIEHLILWWLMLHMVGVALQR